MWLKDYISIVHLCQKSHSQEKSKVGASVKVSLLMEIFHLHNNHFQSAILLCTHGVGIRYSGFLLRSNLRILYCARAFTFKAWHVHNTGYAKFERKRNPLYCAGSERNKRKKKHGGWTSYKVSTNIYNRQANL